MSVEKDLIDYWGNSIAETIDIAAFNFAMAFAMDNATIEHPIDIKTQIKDFIEWSRPCV